MQDERTFVADILIVDDDTDLADALGAVLESLGHSVRTASDGEAGLRAVVERAPELVVLDVEMPRLSGPDMAARMVVMGAGREKIPIVLSSGYRNLAAIATEVRTPYILPKPASIGSLTAIIDRALSERGSSLPLAHAD